MGATLDLAHPDALPTSLDKLGVDISCSRRRGGHGARHKDRQLTRYSRGARVFDVRGGDTVTACGTALGRARRYAEGAKWRITRPESRWAVGRRHVSPVEVLAMHGHTMTSLGNSDEGVALDQSSRSTPAQPDPDHNAVNRFQSRPAAQDRMVDPVPDPSLECAAPAGRSSRPSPPCPCRMIRVR